VVVFVVDFDIECDIVKRDLCKILLLMVTMKVCLVDFVLINFYKLNFLLFIVDERFVKM
jgi:hypothetical protein